MNLMQHGCTDYETLRTRLVPYLSALKARDLYSKPFFTGLDEHLNDDDGSGGGGGGGGGGNGSGGFLGGNQLQLNSPARSSPHSNGSETTERFSRKVFVGGLPPDIDEEEITSSFNTFGDLIVDWPHKAESKSYFPPKGYAFLLFQEERGVQKLIETCVPDDDKLYITVSSPTIKNKAVQIRPWKLADADFVLDASMPLDPRKTVFVGGVPRPLKAYELAMIMDRLYGGVCYAGIDTDPELKYPKGAGRVAFSNQQSYIAAISARFVQLQHGDIDKRVEVKPYVLDDQMCDECHGQRCGGKFAPFFCANVTCLQPRSISTATARTSSSSRTSGGTAGPSAATGPVGCIGPTSSLACAALSTGVYYGGNGANAGFSGSSSSYVPPPPSFPWTTGSGTSSTINGAPIGLSGVSKARQHQLSRPPPLPSSSTSPSSSSHSALGGSSVGGGSCGGSTSGNYHHLQARYGASQQQTSALGPLVPSTSSSSLNRCSSIDHYPHSSTTVGNSSNNGSNHHHHLASSSNSSNSGSSNHHNHHHTMLGVKKEDLLKQRLAKLQSLTPTPNVSP
uniref:RRM domain-containing protein n=1 Tax=Anopheles albimanus TaxID=7167 RepID=A0A182FPZ4_ANOAL